MKNLFLFFAFLVCNYSLIAQRRIVSPTIIPSEAYYLKLSKQQKNAATGFIIGGGAIILVGGFIWTFSGIAGLSVTGDVDGARRTGQTITFMGAGLAAVSIPLFIASTKNKEKAALYAGTTSFTYPLQPKKELFCIGTKINF